MDNFFGFLGAYYLIPSLIIGMIGFLLGWFLKPSSKREGDLSIEGEGALRAEADSLRARVQDLEGQLSACHGENSDMKAALAVSSQNTVTEKTTEADDTYALEWQNRYLAARVKYLDSRLADMSDDKSEAGALTTAAVATTVAATAVASNASKPKKKEATATTKKASANKSTAAAKQAPKPKVLYTDGPTDGDPDDLKAIKGIGPKFEKDLNDKGVYYYRQIAAWKRKDVDMVEGIIDSFPGRIDRDEWIPQAKGLAKGGAKKSTATAKKKNSTKPKADARMERYYENVKKFDGRASRTVVENIVKYCGVSLRSRDSSLVACSDESELQTVAKGFVTKKLGLEDGQMDLVKSVCEQMKSQRMKNRVTFYYLAAKKAKKLDLFK